MKQHEQTCDVWTGGEFSEPERRRVIAVRFSLTRPEAKVPTYATGGSVGLDLYACENQSLTYGSTAFFDTGVVVELPDGCEGQVRGRSGLAKRGVFACGGLGTCDSDYRGPIGVSLAWVANRLQKDFVTGHNGKESTIDIKAGDRIAQLVIVPVPRIHLQQVPLDNLNTTQRGAGGFGSSGR